MIKRWKILSADQERINQLHDALGINPALCQVLVQRGMDTYEKAKQYFRPELSMLHDPWLMKDMEKAVQRLLSAFERKEKILVYGDYDVDGTTSVAIMYSFLSKLYPDYLLEFYIPHRYREGYGISAAGIEFARDNGFTLIVSLDCGIKSTDLIAEAKSLGIDFIVCDHHQPDEELPPAVAILNPKQKDCGYPYKELCGCGVGFKLITALSKRLAIPDSELFSYLDLVATAIAADIVPVTGENRVLAFFGVKKVNENPNNGIKALIRLSKLEKEIHITNLVFMIAPRVNAAGRMDDARKAVLMFIAPTFEEAMHYAEMLHSDNTDRREADSSITLEALALIDADDKLKKRNSTVVFQSHWHKGVVGIVASRLMEKYYRPTIVLTSSGQFIAGSARSVHGFNLYEAVHACRDFLLGYGGHFAAAGMTLTPENLSAFSDKFEEVVSATIDPELLKPEISIDAEVRLKDFTNAFYRIILQMEPFGPGNTRPVFIIRNVFDNGFSRIVKENHVRFSLRQENIGFTGIGFNMADRFHLIRKDTPLDIVCTLDENEWNEKKSLQLKMIDFRLSAENTP